MLGQHNIDITTKEILSYSVVLHVRRVTLRNQTTKQLPN